MLSPVSVQGPDEADIHPDQWQALQEADLADRRGELDMRPKTGLRAMDAHVAGAGIVMAVGGTIGLVLLMTVLGRLGIRF